MSVDPFVVHVARLRRTLGKRHHEVRRGPLDPHDVLAPPSAADSRLPEGAEAVADLWLEPFSGGVMVSGTVVVPWVGVCRRCTAPVGGDLSVSVRERFVDVGGRQSDPGATATDDDAYPIVDDRLDLGPMLREAVALELPLAPLCRDDCLGLCPHCGVDRNHESCRCVAPRDPRWANLDVLRSIS